MEKQDFIQTQVEQALNRIGFIDHYEAMSNQFHERNESFIYDLERVVEYTRTLGLPLKYTKSKEFFSEEVIGAFTFKFGFTIRFNSFEFGLSIINESIGIQTSAPWHLLIQLMTDWGKQGGVVAFKDYEDINGILTHFVRICQSIKVELLRNYP
ncbi:hypothetical protein [Marinoscillum pacificum]|uniref:hypothetical protein n=1 Tax=Marinoscillum pacificum TaxID=392723 RepID=UPI0021572AE6|nr:hypothetical protein [Marinoscillum pacificum]